MRVIRQSEYKGNSKDKNAFALHVLRDVRARRTRPTRAGAAPHDNDSVRRAVRAIIRAVRNRGDDAIYGYEKKFGGLQSPARAPLRLSAADIRRAYEQVTPAQRAAIRDAARRLGRTEKATMRRISGDIRVSAAAQPRAARDKEPDLQITRRFVPLRSVGCYIPGGAARYPSSAVMSVLPAAIAGVPRIAAVSPVVRGQDEMDPLTIVAADSCGATEIYRVGGVHAVAALAYGTESIPAVDKIVGPGGAYVTAAKSAVSADVGIDMLAGPTELCILADARAPARLAALDLISQAEHSADTQCYLITTSEDVASRVNDLISEIIPGLEQRGDIVRASMENNGFVIVADGMDSAIRVADALAPEHLQIMAKNAERVARRLTTPGMILLGAQSPSAASDYVFGSNHVLPTRGSGAVRGSLSALDFVKMITIAGASNTALRGMRDSMREIAHAEGLFNHYEALRGRLADAGYGGGKPARSRPAPSPARGRRGRVKQK